jgi:hypothetical protein
MTIPRLHSSRIPLPILTRSRYRLACRAHTRARMDASSPAPWRQLEQAVPAVTCCIATCRVLIQYVSKYPTNAAPRSDAPSH